MILASNSALLLSPVPLALSSTAKLSPAAGVPVSVTLMPSKLIVEPAL